MYTGKTGDVGRPGQKPFSELHIGKDEKSKRAKGRDR